jgi:hypothetical protein
VSELTVVSERVSTVVGRSVPSWLVWGGQPRSGVLTSPETPKRRVACLRRMAWANLLPPMVLGLLLSSACAALVPFPIVRESQLPLSGKRVLVAAPRAVAAPLAAALIAAGARPLWSQCIITEPLDEESLGQLDDALLRLTEYDLLLLLSRDAVDAVVQRGLLLSDSSEDVLRLMLRASNAEIAALGPAALHLSATLKLAAGAVPVDPTPDGLAAVLSALGTVQAGSRVLVPTYADTYAPEPPYCT